MQIASATLADLDCVAALFDAYRQFYEQPADVALARSFIEARMRRGESLVLLARADDGAALGFVQLYPGFCSIEAAPIRVLYDLFVQPAARRAGVGRALLLAAEAQARADGIARLDLTTARSNLKAQALYESLGWVQDRVYLAYNRHIRG
ncbi:GNAT family N-acetyltransferase [Derxia lacustris]|uniref:GNAT family N-acetyltransferase n=1 Tax=Derxia lacustris TaxID=764842 RepID=UPI000A17738B|nr:GNAT family N-acetyltransferase [Derxia lacustris]